MMGTFRYIGTSALHAKGRAAIKAAVTEAAEDLVGKAQERTPVDTGTLKASIHVAGVSGVGSNSARATYSATVSTGGEANEYAVFVHEGTGPHLIAAKNGKALHFNGVFARSVNHPGTAAHRFMSDALIAERAVYVAAIAAAARGEF